MLRLTSKKKNNSAGYFLLETLLAISILAIGVTSCVKVFGQCFRVQQKIAETAAGKSVSEALLFRLVSGDLSEILSKKGSWKRDSIMAADWPLGKLNYEILSQQIGDSEGLYRVEIKIFTPAGREIYNTRGIVRNEVSTTSSESEKDSLFPFDKQAFPPFFQRERGESLTGVPDTRWPSIGQGLAESRQQSPPRRSER